MILKLQLPVSGFSINAAYYASRKIKTTAFRDWEEVVHFHLKKYEDVLKPLRLAFEDGGGTFSVTYMFFVPKDKYYTKHGAISRRSMDLTNVEKSVQDMVFGALGVDDQFVTTMRSYKVPSTSYSIEIILKFNKHGGPDGSVSAA